MISSEIREGSFPCSDFQEGAQREAQAYPSSSLTKTTNLENETGSREGGKFKEGFNCDSQNIHHNDDDAEIDMNIDIEYRSYFGRRIRNGRSMDIKMKG